MTMTLISTTTLATATASITFSSIPQTATDLYLVVSHRNAGGANQDNLLLRINGSSANTYVSLQLYGNGSSTFSGSQTATADNYTYSNSASSTSNTFASTQYYIPNYALTGTKNWSVDTVFENNATTGYQQIIATLYNTSVAGITSITLSSGYNLVTGTTASLYTITKGSGGATVA